MIPNRIVWNRTTVDRPQRRVITCVIRNWTLAVLCMAIILIPTSTLRAQSADATAGMQFELRNLKRSLDTYGAKHPARANLIKRIEQIENQLGAAGELSSSRSASGEDATSNMASGDDDEAEIPTKIAADPRRRIAVSDLKLIGGWRIPAAIQSGKSSAFSLGGLCIESLGETNRFWITHHDHLSGVQSLSGGAMGTGDQLNWPLLTADQYISVSSEYGGLQGAGPRGLHYDAERDLLFVSGRSHYAVPPYMGPWLVAIRGVGHGSNDPNPEFLGPWSVDGTTMQQNGGGFCQIGEEFADQYLDGRTLGLACGGYESGQGCSLGPTLTATYPDIPNISRGKVLLKFGWNVGANERERRFPDYEVDSLDWAIPPADGVGYWHAERISGGPAWVETSEVQGLVYFVSEGVGEVIYRLQNAHFTRKTKTRMYVYSLDDLARVATAERRPSQIHGKFEEFDVPGVVGKPMGACFDRDSGRLFVFMEQTWKLGVETMPSIAVFVVDTPIL